MHYGGHGWHSSFVGFCSLVPARPTHATARSLAPGGHP
ncbi:hypothetical protein ANMWB30_33000 [Arthrobacter sp. MWB30]|nr:hypothetical protein ANMWB30_33000 [Arthrobacter sp. MWB30]